MRDIITKEQTESIIQDYQTLGIGCVQLGRKYGRSDEAIRQLLRRNNIQMRKQSSRRLWQVNENFFEVIDTQEKAYTLGFICADGNVKVKEAHANCLTIELNKKDEDILTKINIAMSGNYPIYYWDREGKTYSKLLISSKKLVVDLIDKGVVPNKTKKLIFRDLGSLTRHFIRGYYDGDGWISEFKTKRLRELQYSFGICGRDCYIQEMNRIIYEQCKNEISGKN